jgi:hypothetical protein
MIRRHPEIKGYILIRNYPGNKRQLGTFEPYTSGEFSKYPYLWKPVYYDDVIRDKKLNQLGIK